MTVSFAQNTVVPTEPAAVTNTEKAPDTKTGDSTVKPKHHHKHHKGGATHKGAGKHKKAHKKPETESQTSTIDNQVQANKVTN